MAVKPLSKSEAAEVRDQFRVRRLDPSETRDEGGWIFEPYERREDDPPLWSAASRSGSWLPRTSTCDARDGD